MQIDLSSSLEQRLVEQASAHGYASVEAYVGESLANVASLGEGAIVFAPLNASQRDRSERLISRGEADLDAGRTCDMREGLLDQGASRGLTLGE
ncbi:hypothetical protein Mal64_20620 [Pseudobythopirellula maris]|uniref:Uncharacterized protein n=1 Tax=Pseudobythopirellula maris TaxID=2527991 RepID=A0A5C5ZN46_9BACT|nr:hypothetical protein [Pseudobythopirellula maris]TWT88578.1 hypothetical protein Mal64_20620 [Pseudobythopirellula maris]